MFVIRLLVASTLMVCALAPASAAVPITITVESAGVTATSVAGTYAVETFTAAPVAYMQDYVHTVSAGAGQVTFSYTDVNVRGADVYSGVAGGNYAGTYNGIGFHDPEGPSYTLDVSSTGGPINFFGAYFASTDATNTLTFLKAGNVVGTVTLDQVWALADYPLGDQMHVYASFSFTGGATYDQIVFYQPNSPRGFESDNHTVGTLSESPMPEPAAWAMMLVGFGAMGTALRRRRPAIA
jgi:hypothetical protein